MVFTGAARGIGACISRHFVDESCSVYVTDIDLEGADAQCSFLGPKAIARRMNVRDRREVRAIIADIQCEAGGIDVLVNNAGLMTTGPPMATTDSEWDDLLSVNVGGIYNCIHAAAPHMLGREQGVVINIASISAYKGGGTFGNVWYGATKAAVIAIAKGLAREFGKHGVRVNAIAPSVVETEMAKTLLSPDIRARILPRFPLGRLATTDDIASLAVFLASDRAAFITGETVAVDGGLLKT